MSQQDFKSIDVENRLDKGALNGLRGLLAFLVMSHHAWCSNPQLTSTRYVIFLYGGFAVPGFFLLSGFSLALAYGGTKWNGSMIRRLGYQTSSSDAIEDAISPRKRRRLFDNYKFYKKRLIRIVPVHFLALSLSLILWSFR